MCSLAVAGDKTPKIPCSTVEKRVAKLTQKLDWQSSLDEAKALHSRLSKSTTVRQDL
jgi:hypothetical protein